MKSTPSYCFTLKFTLLLVLIPFAVMDLAAQCCENTACRDQAKQFVTAFKPMTARMGTAPDDEADAIAKLDSIRGIKPMLHDSFVAQIQLFRVWSSTDGGPKGLCFNDLLGTDFATGQWVNEARSVGMTNKVLSSQFCRGFQFRVEANIGATNLGARSERFHANLRALLSYTIAPTNHNIDSNSPPDMHCGGRIRLLVGLTEAYLSNVGVLSGTAKIEYRIKDFSSEKDIQSFANIKLFGLYTIGITREVQSYGGGLGFETGLFGLNITYERYDRLADSGIQVGLVVPF